MPITWNQQLVKKENKSLVLSQIINHAPLSRADIAQRSGLNKGTVSSLVAELIEEKLINESGPGESSGGRRPVMLHFNHGAGHTIGIDLGVNYILGVLTDLSGNIIVHKNESYKNISYEDTMSRVVNIIKALISAAPPSPYNIVGIGVGTPGIVDKKGILLLAPNLGWHDIPFQTELERIFQIPVIVENEANTGAYGEKRFGVGQHADNLIYISAGIGIGAGIIINGELYSGFTGYSGEVGHMTIDRNGVKCTCGNKGCWELYASEQALLSKYYSKNLKKENGLDDIISLAKQGNKEVLETLAEIGENLALGIINIIHAFNPEQIIIGNRLASCKQWLEPKVKEVIQQYTSPFNQTDIRIDFSNPIMPVSAIGASAFSAEAFLKAQLEIK
ncbi:ROK family transcriptional regulator [Niallia circulans]|uniref:ROK family transcriptional regulator n=1 Tax=Niallia circulans TaxID=1397 RepID=A0A553SPS8_NIACI|nr:ROK family transcriptional regulator [Niallia circulans]TRZ38989.1 ROK family transcriptional regulator [Niallia circulans]